MKKKSSSLIILLLIAINLHSQDFRLSAYATHFNSEFITEARFFGLSSSFEESSMRTWGTQIDLSYTVAKNLNSGFLYSRMSGNDAFGAEVTVNHYACSLSYFFSMLNNKLKLIPQFAAGPQRFESVSSGNSEFSLNLLQSRYKITVELGLTDKLFLSSYYSYAHNLARAVQDKSPSLSIGKNLTSKDLGVGLAFYLER